MTGLPRSSGLSRCSTAAKNASRSTWRIVLGALVTRGIVASRGDSVASRESKPPGPRTAGRSRGRGRRSALGLDDDRHLGGQALVDLDRDLVRAERLDRLLEVDLVAVHGDPAPAERLGDVLVVDRAVELAALADLHAHRERRRRDAGGRDVGLLALALALLLAAGDVVLVRAIGTARRRDRKLLGD